MLFMFNDELRRIFRFCDRNNINFLEGTKHGRFLLSNTCSFQNILFKIYF